MKRRRALDVRAAVGGAATAIGMGVITWLGFAAVSTPTDLKARLSEVERRTDQAEVLLAHTTNASAYPPGALCRLAPAEAVVSQKQVLQTAVARAGASLVRLDLAAGASDEALGGLTPIPFTLEAKGRYDQVITLLKDLAKSRPEIFVDHTDLDSENAAVAVKLRGRVYCSTSARL